MGIITEDLSQGTLNNLQVVGGKLKLKNKPYLQFDGVDDVVKVDAKVGGYGGQSGPMALAGPEQISNTSFETDTSGWVLGANTTRVGVPSGSSSYFGSYCLKSTGNDSCIYDFGQVLNFPLCVRGHVYIESYSAGDIVLELLDANDNIVKSFSATTTVTGQWQILSMYYNGKNARKLRVTNGGANTVYWDQFACNEVWNWTMIIWWVAPTDTSKDHEVFARFGWGTLDRIGPRIAHRITYNSLWIYPASNDYAYRGIYSPFSYSSLGVSGHQIDGNLHFLALVNDFDNAKIVRRFDDDVYEVNNLMHQSVNVAQYPGFSSKFSIAAENNGQSMFGAIKLHHFRAYKRALSTAEIDQIKNDINALTDDPALWVLWDVNEGSGTTLTDKSPNAINGPITGATWQTDPARYVRQGTRVSPVYTINP